jgi:predicted dehydrogenase
MVRIGIAGAGLMGRWHARYARQLGASIIGVVDPNRPPSELKQRFRGAVPFSDTKPLLQLQPDILHVCTPLKTHEDIVEMALEAGIHVLVEKPLAPTAKSAERLVAKAAERNLLLTPVHQYVFQDGVVRAAASLQRIGTPLHFDAVICSAGGNHLREEQLDDLAADILPHPLSLLDNFFPGILANIEWMSIGSTSGELRITGADRALSVSILVSLHGRPTESSVRLTGTKGTIHLDLFHGFVVMDPGGVSRTRKMAHPFSLAGRTFLAAGTNFARRALCQEPAYPGLRTLIGSFYRAVQQRSSAPLSAHHVLDVARVRDQLCARTAQRPLV